MAATEFIIKQERRPCWVNGRRAMFHQWANSARAVVPRGMTEEDTQERYQYHSVRGIVEYEDGTMDRAWPSEIQFADGGDFHRYNWEWMEEALQARADREPDINRECKTCAHKTDNADDCAAADYDCIKCTAALCPCKTCSDGSNWKRGDQDGAETD